MPDAPEAKVRARAGAIGFPEAMADTPVSRALRRREGAAAARARDLRGPHLVILDEPTNHLDIDSRAALIEAINDYPGAVILVSHDRYLIEACADRLWLVADGGVAPFDGDLDDYRRLVLSDGGTAGDGADRNAQSAPGAREPGRDPARRRREAHRACAAAPAHRRPRPRCSAWPRRSHASTAARRARPVRARSGQGRRPVEGARRGRRCAGARRGGLARGQRRVRSRQYLKACEGLRTSPPSSPRKAGIHTLCPLDSLRRMGPRSKGRLRPSSRAMRGDDR